MVGSDRPRRWPAYAVAALLLGYAAGKAAFAMQSRLGFPGGPPVHAAEAQSYFMDAAIAQWFASATGVLAAIVAIATVTTLGRRVPRMLMLFVLTVMLLAVGGGAGIMILDGFVGLGVGWQWYHGVLGILVIALSLEMTRSYATATRPVSR
ncbi:hypothetical protein HII36_07045 [Nonomuraea sp. NN258]|uniref:hypothetical protein n=1 Tax=Nonomuraea antri TaxID=2730852 RepID=UPI001568863E|nr:hypothetical protein [Nonomuraea antri]NRQ31599.1 hypothetical protein [Nonomuraea antri]